MRIVHLMIMIAFVGTSCSAQDRQEDRLTGTIWKCAIADDCINAYEFRTDSTYVFINCEMRAEYYGDYYFENGSLMLDEKGRMNTIPDSHDHGDGRRLYRVSIDGNIMKHVSFSDRVNDEWVLSDFEFDPDYPYKRVFTNAGH